MEKKKLQTIKIIADAVEAIVNLRGGLGYSAGHPHPKRQEKLLYGKSYVEELEDEIRDLENDDKNKEDDNAE